jgi:hypothetical protein
VGADLFVPAYVEEVGNCGLTDTCESELAQTWRSRWVADRPPPDTTIPIFHWTGGMDTFILPGFQKCGLDRLEAQGGDAPAPCEPLDEYDPMLECSIPIIPNSLNPDDP